MNKTMKQAIITTILVLLLLAACSPAPAPTQSPVDIANLVGTSVALTVASQNLDTAEAQPAATETPLPTATLELPTPTAVETAIPIPSPTLVSTGGGGGGGSTTTKSEFSCEAINRRPYDNTSYKPGARFDIKWTIHNNGTKTLNAGLDLKYSNGAKFMADKVIELPELKPGAEYSVSFDGVAPDKPGNYTMVYIVEGGLCYPYTAIVVEK